MTAGSHRLAQFLAFSSDVTAFTEFELRGTGQAQAYLSATENVVGEALIGKLLDGYMGVKTMAEGDPPTLVNLLRAEIFSDEKLGPVARNIVKLWYVGIWYELPRAWTEAFGALEEDFTFMVSPTAYTEGLLWPAIGASPPGAKAPGYGSWVAPPRIPAFETAE